MSRATDVFDPEQHGIEAVIRARKVAEQHFDYELSNDPDEILVSMKSFDPMFTTILRDTGRGSNDVFRCDDPPVDSPDPRWRANAEALLACLNEEPVQRMFAIELNRELGRPGAALAILDRLEIPEESELKRALRALCEFGDTRVRELKLY